MVPGRMAMIIAAAAPTGKNETDLLPQGKKDCVPKDTGDCSGKLFESGCAGRYGYLP